MKAEQILKRYLDFFEEQGHKRITNSPLVLVNDPTTLFTSSGMQALIPYLLGEPHAAGKRLVNVQNCIRSQDIDGVGDNRHTTFFRMLGNWSLGDYFKKEQLSWFFEFLTNNTTGLGLDPERLYVTVFAGDDQIPRDEESISIWKDLFADKELTAEVIDDAETNGMQDGRIFTFDVKKNWWSRSGVPAHMPAGEPGGPDSEVFYDFGTPHDEQFGEHCHPNCDCGRFMEIGNSVFMQYQKQADGSFKELPQKNVDFGGGFERLAAAKNHNPDVFTTDLYDNIIATVEVVTGKSYADRTVQASMRIIADHLKAATFLMMDNVIPSNKEQGYVLRRLLRRAAVKMHQLHGSLPPVTDFQKIVDAVLETEERIDDRIQRDKARGQIFPLLDEELGKFAKSLEKGLRILEKTGKIDGKIAFDLYQTYGFPVEITAELVEQKGQEIDLEEFLKEVYKHRDLSRTASAGMFKGGLQDHSEKTIMGHTATHLLHQALRDVLGTHVHQSGSNITPERVRFDFNFDRKLSDEEIHQIENIVNEKIKENLPVHFEVIPTKEAHSIGAIGLFMDTYGEKSKIYFIGGDNPFDKNSTNKPYSIEFCGGPHVNFTGELKSFKIIKQENLGKGMKRLYGVTG
ncbi:MAG TPA: alanine--tRNA ligase [Patescibacteria group bacterium]|nr:alanine--tRNA ligase [Patescibacteria group bacterium]